MSNTTMAPSKPWYLSKGMWGGIIAAAGGAILTSVQAGAIPVPAPVVAAIPVVTILAGLLATIGRAVAKSTIR